MIERTFLTLRLLNLLHGRWYDLLFLNHQVCVQPAKNCWLLGTYGAFWYVLVVRIYTQISVHACWRVLRIRRTLRNNRNRRTVTSARLERVRPRQAFALFSLIIGFFLLLLFFIEWVVLRRLRYNRDPLWRFEWLLQRIALLSQSLFLWGDPWRLRRKLPAFLANKWYVLRVDLNRLLRRIWLGNRRRWLPALIMSWLRYLGVQIDFHFDALNSWRFWWELQPRHCQIHFVLRLLPFSVLFHIICWERWPIFLILLMIVLCKIVLKRSFLLWQMVYRA